MQFEHFIGSNKSQYKNTEYETVELVPKPEIMHFKPSLRNDYDTEFGEMSRNIKECEALNEESQVMIDTLKEKYNESKSLFFCIIKTLAKFIFSVIKDFLFR